MKLDRIPSVGNRQSKRLGSGRGNGHGKTCGRGHKGAGQRSGYGTKLGFEGGARLKNHLKKNRNKL